MKRFRNSINELTADHGSQRQLNSEELSKLLDISFHFKLSDEKQNELISLVESAGILSPSELLSNYTADDSEVNELINFLVDSGFINVRKSSDGCSVFASGTMEVISSSLNCNMVTVENELGRNIVATTEPSLPESISINIDSINGLQPLAEFNKLNRRDNTIFFQKRFAQNRFNKLVNYSRPYLIDAIKSAYNALNTPSDGRGQVIGILIDRVPNSLDLIRFWRLNNQSTSLSRVSNINVNNLRLGPANGEETLDVQWSSGIAPGSRVNVYATGLLTFSAVERGLDRIFYDVLRTPTLRQISISLGIGERYLTPGELISKNDKYLRLRALGVNIFVSSGDSGSHPSGVLQVAKTMNQMFLEKSH